MSSQVDDEVKEVEGGGDAGGSDTGEGTGDIGGDGEASADGGANEPAHSVAATPTGITMDDRERYLVEIVANHGLSKVASEIAEQVGTRSGKILLVDELEFAVTDVYYNDIKNKLKSLTKLANDEVTRCDQHRQSLERYRARETTGDTDFLTTFFESSGAQPWAVEAVPKAFSLVDLTSSLLPSVTGVGTVATAVATSLKAIGDVISYFRAEYDIKGQATTNIDDFYVKTVVANRLLKKENKIQLLNFNVVDQSALMTGLDELTRTHLLLLICLEGINLDAMVTKANALNEYLTGLRSKYAEALLEIDPKVIEELENEVANSEMKLMGYLQKRVPDAQINALQIHLESLRESLVEVVSSNTGAAVVALRAELQAVATELQVPNLPQVKKAELEAYRKGLIDQLVKGVVSGGSDIDTKLVERIKSVTQELDNKQLDRIPNFVIEAEKAHLANLRSKLLELKSIRNNDAADALKEVIQKVEKQIALDQKTITEAKRSINGGKKVSDAVTTFIGNITTTAAGETYPPLVNACLHEYTVEKSNDVAYLLKIKLVSAGAELISEKSWGFWNTPDLAYIGGGGISYVLADTTGEIVAADTIHKVSKLVHKIGKGKRQVDYDLE